MKTMHEECVANINSALRWLECFSDQLGIVGIAIPSSMGIARLRVEFNNGYQLSIIQGDGTYGSASGLYEIAIYDNLNNYAIELHKEIHSGDDVIGFLDPREIFEYIRIIGNAEIKTEGGKIDEDDHCNNQAV